MSTWSDKWLCEGVRIHTVISVIFHMRGVWAESALLRCEEDGEKFRGLWALSSQASLTCRSSLLWSLAAEKLFILTRAAELPLNSHMRELSPSLKSTQSQHAGDYQTWIQGTHSIIYISFMWQYTLNEPLYCSSAEIYKLHVWRDACNIEYCGVDRLDVPHIYFEWSPIFRYISMNL